MTREHDRNPPHKAKYEPPVVVDLGAMTRGKGDACKVGLTPQAVCKTGSEPTMSCRPGSQAHQCNAGSGG